MDVNELGLALWLPLASGVLEVADQLLLLGIDGNDGDSVLDAVLSLGVDVLELRIPIGMLRAFDGFVWRLHLTSETNVRIAHSVT